MKFKPYALTGTHPLDHIALEEALVESWPGPEAALLFYVNSPCVVIGRNQNPWREASVDSVLPVFRRSSGGGAVYHDLGNLNWAIIIPRGEHSQERELEAVAGAIRALGAAASVGDRGGIFGASGSVIAGKKISGTARRFGTKNVLHHGTLLVAADLDALHASLGGIDTFDDVSISSTPAKPANLSQVLPGISMDAAISGISRAIAGRLPSEFPNSLIDPSAVAAIRVKFSSVEWIYGNTPKFSLRVAVGGVDVVLRVARGIVVGAEINPTRCENLPAQSAAFAVDLVGERFSFDIL